MKKVNEVITGYISQITPQGVLTITAKYDDWFTLTKREYHECLIQLKDSRVISTKQRNACYALIGEIAEYTGMSKSEAKEFTKLEFLTSEITDMANTIFSLSDASVSLVCQFQKFLVRFIIDHDIPTSKQLLDYVDDVQDYIYGCLINKKCCICGQPCDLHHVDTVGAGRDRTEIIHEGMKVLPLCRTHHTEYHTIGGKTFIDKYHLTEGVVLDKTLCKIYKLKTKKEGN